MNNRLKQKQKSRQKILGAASKRLRLEGLGGAGVAAVMEDAGLTHGAFYSHFRNKGELARAALTEALSSNRERWTGKFNSDSWSSHLSKLANRYLTRKHRDNLGDACALTALCSEAARSDPEFQKTYEAELLKTVRAISQQGDHDDPSRREDALAFFSLLVGSMALSRAVSSSELSDEILESAKKAAARLASEGLDGGHLI